MRHIAIVGSGPAGYYTAEAAQKEFGDEVRAEVPRRAAVNEAFQVGDRLGDRPDVPAQGLAGIFRGFLERDLLQRTGVNIPEGALR